MLNQISLKAIGGAAVFTVVAVTGIGFAVDPNGFFGNLLAEIAGVLLSILLAVFIIERLLERERSRRWHLVAKETMATLRFALVRTGLGIYLKLPAPRPADADPYMHGLYRQDELTDALRILAGHVETAPALGDGMDLVADTKPHLDLIRDGVMPRLLAIGEHNLVARLAALEGAFQELQHTVWLADQFGESNQLQPIAARLVGALADASEAIDKIHD